MLIHKYILLLFICLLVIYYHVLSNLFVFNYVKIEDINVIKPNNLTSNGNPNIFVATLENGIGCNIGIKNEVMINNFKKNIEENGISYYTFVDKNICSKPENIMEIIFYYLLFYYCILIGSVITLVILANIFFECEILLNKEPVEIKKINYQSNLNV